MQPNESTGNKIRVKPGLCPSKSEKLLYPILVYRKNLHVENDLDVDAPFNLTFNSIQKSLHKLLVQFQLRKSFYLRDDVYFFFAKIMHKVVIL